jgi:hypothetical protein
MLLHPYKVLALKFGVIPYLYQSIVIFSHNSEANLVSREMFRG